MSSSMLRKNAVFAMTGALAVSGPVKLFNDTTCLKYV